MFKKGQSGNPKGKSNPGLAGRKPDWLKEMAQKEFERSRVIEFYGKVVRGEDFEQGVGNEGEVIKIPASIKDRIRAGELLKEWFAGKTPQPLEHSGEIKTESEEDRKARRESIIAFLKEQTK